MFKYRKQIIRISDIRAKRMSECITGIRTIKYFGWENIFKKKFQSIRNLESKIIFKSNLIFGFNDLFMILTPQIVFIVVFGSLIVYSLFNTIYLKS